MSDDWEEKTFLWFFRSDDEPMLPKSTKEQWTLYPISDEIELAYNDYLHYKRSGNSSEFSIFEIDTNYVIDFENNVQRTKDSSKQRLVGRFEGDKISNKDFANTLTYHKYRWYFETEEGHWAPYRVDDKHKIEAEYFKYTMSKAGSIYQGSYFNLNFKEMQETNKLEEKTKKVERFLDCPTNIGRTNYYSNSVKPQKTNSLTTVSMDTIQNVKKDFYLNFKNIFPTKHKEHTFLPFHKKVEKLIKFFLNTHFNQLCTFATKTMIQIKFSLTKLFSLGIKKSAKLIKNKKGK